MLRKTGIAMAAFLVATALLTGFALAETYKIDAVHSSVRFGIRHIFSRTTGSFTDFEGEIAHDPEDPGASSVTATILVSSIDTNNERRDGHLKSPDFFDVVKYPEITFNSTEVKVDGDRLLVRGDLTMHGVTQSVVLPVDVLGVGEHPMRKAPIAGFSAELTIKRSDHGVNSWTDAAGVLGDEVAVSLNIEAVGVKKEADKPEEADESEE
ncbi:MAG: YceI family protein [Candidatus Latescibacteria bacterium]|jgi:polyisoprenoid-binding protein YceI|nr:YceI family protein [Candidatus Latescibacterota bacterium]